MKNRVDKLLKEKQKALSNIRFAKNRSRFLTKVNKSKEHDNNYKKSYRDMMQEKLREQKDEIERKRLEMRANIITSKKCVFIWYYFLLFTFNVYFYIS